MFKLVIEDDEGNKTVVPIIRDEITIGRKDGSTIRLTERNVSRDHARLVREEGDVFFEEVSARYGTRKNGERIAEKTDFSVGDVFTIGDYRLTLQSDVVPEAKPPKKPNGASPPPLKSDDGDAPDREDIRATLLDPPRKEGTEIIAADPAKLVIVSSNFAGQDFPLARREMVIGRGEECDIIIDHRSVSQKHAKIVREQNGEYKIVDLKSKNGVKVGGEEYRAVHLKRGDILELGHVKFRFVEAGENYIFTPQIEDDAPPSGSKKGMVLVGVAVVAVVALIAVFGFLGDGPPKTQPIATATNNSPGTIADDPVDVPVAVSPLDAKIDKAEQDYLAGRVQKSSGMLELLRDEKSITPAQVARIDDLLSKTKRERGFVRYFENGRDHFEAKRWMDALAEFRQIPDDDELNIYRLVRESQYVDNAVASATDEQLELAKSGDATKREDALDKLSELKAMFPNHVAPSEALAELAVVAKPVPKPNKRPVNNDKRPNGDGDTLIVQDQPAANAQLADDLYTAAMKEMLSGNYKGAISKARGAIDNGCTSKCYRVVGMAHHKLDQPKKACTWLAKAGNELPSDLDCP